MANACGNGPPVKCRGGAEQTDPPPCATGTCGGFFGGGCNPEAFCQMGRCTPDQPNGEGCGTDNGACQSGHCQNGVCCSEGDCCENDSQCPAVKSCDDLLMCQGHRQERFCDVNSGTCAKGMLLDDDSGCINMQSTRDCDLNISPMCTMNTDQPDAPECGRCVNLPRCASSHAESRVIPQRCNDDGCSGGGSYTVIVCDLYVNDIPVGCKGSARCDSLSGQCY